MRGWFALLLLICAATTASAAERKRVLLLHSFGPQFAPWVFVSAAFREQLFKLSDKIDLYEASLESAKFQKLEEEDPTVDYLVHLFTPRQLDLIVTIGGPAALFVQKYRGRFFPAVPLVIGSADLRLISSSALTSNEAPITVTLDEKKWIENILQVLPDTTHIAWAVGASPLERMWTEEFRRASQSFTDRVSFEWFNDLRFEEVVERVSKLPPHSVIFFVDLRVDAAGVPIDQDLVVPRLRAATNSPIFSYVENYIGRGIVGGPMFATGEIGRQIAKAAMRILNGEVPGELKIPNMVEGAPQYDWRELQSWKISESRLPPGSTVLFREPTVWKRYSWQLSLIAAVVIAQAGLIWALLQAHRRRRLTELQYRQRTAELVHVNRIATAGELTASIAHEMSQPLGAILTNAETARAILKSPNPDIAELDEIVGDILRDDRRADQVIRRMRSLLKKAPFELKSLDFNDLVRETVELVLAVGRKVELASVITQDALPIVGDRIQLQQVILNLVANGIDAIKDTPTKNRIISIRTSRVEEFAELSVSDCGPGIPEDKLKEVFEPFFTSKAEGMGMGLSIARTIIEAHNGQISAENQHDGGAAFRIKLPLAL